MKPDGESHLRISFPARLPVRLIDTVTHVEAEKMSGRSDADPSNLHRLKKKFKSAAWDYFGYLLP